MNYLTTDLAQALVENRDIKEIFREHLEHAVNQLLRNELTCFLDYEPYDAKGINSGNSRNGYYSRKFNTEFGELSIQVPRDCNGFFEQQTVAPYKRNSDSLEEVVIHLYKKGVTTSEIADLMGKMYGHHYSKQTISNFTKMVEADIEAYKSSPLNKRYDGKARVSDREEIADDFKKIHQATDLESAQEALKAFEKKWRPSY